MPLITGGRSPQAAKGATRQKDDYSRKDPSPAYREVAQHKTIRAPHVPALLSSTYSPANRAKALPRVSSSLPVFHLPLPLPARSCFAVPRDASSFFRAGCVLHAQRAPRLAPRANEAGHAQQRPKSLDPCLQGGFEEPLTISSAQGTRASAP